MNPHAPNVMKNQVDISGKIKSQHLNRKAVIYIRQSTLQQVHRHQESTRLQYGLGPEAAKGSQLNLKSIEADPELSPRIYPPSNESK